MILVVIITGLIATSCSSAAKKGLKLAKENNKETNAYLDQARKDSQEKIKVTAKVDWEKFNNNAQTEIEKRKIQIEKLRGEISEISKKEQQKFTATLDTLKQKNNSLKKRLAQINKKLKANLEHINESDEVIKTAFERAFVRDMNELLAGLRDFWKYK